jgi:hypothetical protein
MVQKISPARIVTVTKDGECHLTITLELNINVNGAGNVSASVKSEDKFIQEDEDKIDFMIPDFLSGAKIDFGKKG